MSGEEIENPAGWLVVVTVRRAIDERRTRHDADRATHAEAEALGREPELEARIDDMRTLRALFAGFRGGLERRELEAATLCYLQGFSRAQAAERMGVSAKRLTKLMEGDERVDGVASKVGELLAAIRAEAWCEEQGSTMRALAFGILDPSGERYRLALSHQRECPRCRRYVRSLRGLAALLPPPAMCVRLAGSGTGAAGGIVVAGAAGGLGGWPLAGSLVAKLAAAGAALSLAAGGALVLNDARRSDGARELGKRSPAIGAPRRSTEPVAAEALRSAVAPWPRSRGSRETSVPAGGKRTARRPTPRPAGPRARRESSPLEFGIEQQPPRSTRGDAVAPRTVRPARGPRRERPREFSFE